MGTTIGINSMILLASCFEFLRPNLPGKVNHSKKLNVVFWGLQISLLTFWLSLNAAGIKKGIWQLSEHQVSYSKMMQSLQPYFIVFVIAGTGLLVFFSVLAIQLLRNASKSVINS